MTTDCIPHQLEFQGLSRRTVVASFDGGTVSSDGGWPRWIGAWGFWSNYGGYCYLPLYIFCGSHLLCSRLREANVDASFGAVAELERIVARIRQKWPEVRILVRGDSGFAREELMSWCEGHGVDFVFGLARNARLQRALGGELEQARTLFEEPGKAARVFKDFV